MECRLLLKLSQGVVWMCRCFNLWPLAGARSKVKAPHGEEGLSCKAVSCNLRQLVHHDEV
eukprot:15478013-Alexandrium_andersonii.AAC.1